MSRFTLYFGILSLFASSGTLWTSAFVGSRVQHRSVPFLASSLANELDASISDATNILTRAADTKQEDSESVLQALVDLEKLARTKARDDPSFAECMLENLDGDWRLVFTTGTVNTEKKIGKINYFPLKAVQSFRTKEVEPMLITNAIFIGDFALIKFSGTMEFDLRKRKLEFDFDKIAVLGFEIELAQGDAAKIGSSTGLGSESNVENAKKNKSAFFNWISADENIATARGGGGGLALWKRVTKE